MDPFQKDDKSYLGTWTTFPAETVYVTAGSQESPQSTHRDHRTMVITVFTEIGAQEPLVV